MQQVSRTAVIEMAFLELMHGSLAMMRCLFECFGFVWDMIASKIKYMNKGLKEWMGKGVWLLVLIYSWRRWVGGLDYEGGA